MFNNRKLLIATKHGKEKIISPIFEKALGVSCFVTDCFDTDTLGTFTGEIERKDDALTTLRKKCGLAMKANNCDLVIASEGSFGSHPTVFIAKADDELMMLMDSKNNLEITAREISMDTNFNASFINCDEELLAFAKLCNFPTQGLILKPAERDFTKIIKGITTFEALWMHFKKFKIEFGGAYVETDMRANYNPTRMGVIKKTAIKLLEAVQSECPECGTPGFTITKILRGLKCEWCKNPTQSALSYQYTCVKCKYTKDEFYPHKKTSEDPSYCDFCNP